MTPENQRDDAPPQPEPGSVAQPEPAPANAPWVPPSTPVPPAPAAWAPAAPTPPPAPLSFGPPEPPPGPLVSPAVAAYQPTPPPTPFTEPATGPLSSAPVTSPTMPPAQQTPPAPQPPAPPPPPAPMGPPAPMAPPPAYVPPQPAYYPPPGAPGQVPGYPGYAPGYPPPMAYAFDPATGQPYSEKSRTVAGVLQLVLGFITVGGVGRMYAGNTAVGVSQLIVCVIAWLMICGGGEAFALLVLTGAWLWSWIDGIVLLTGRPVDAEGRPLRP